jgi:micrococcal nuclease
MTERPSVARFAVRNASRLHLLTPIVVLILILLMGSGCETVATAPTEVSAATARTEVMLLDVVDGDTIWVRMPDGSKEKVRYIGIDAPEIAHADSAGEYLGEEATAHNAELLAAGPLRIETDVDERDDFGRLLAYVWAGNVFVNERMVLDGYAWAHNYPPNLTRQEQLWDAHDKARAAGIGIWAEE